MKFLRNISLFLHFFVGLGAIAGGSAAILDPVNPLGITVDALRIGPFSTFLIPGIVLFTIIGLGNILAGVTLIRGYRYGTFCTGAMGVILAGWIGVQCLVLLDIHFLHVIFFVIACVQGLIALVLLREEGLFPWTLWDRLRKRKP